MRTYTKVVVHAGQAHNDDFLALAFLLALLRRAGEAVLPPAFRRDPTPEELEDPNVLVLDVGGQHDPEKSNFDHHQLPRDAEPACALSLFLASVAPELLINLKRFTKWFDAVIVIDSKGPFAWAKANGLPEFPFGLVGAIEAPIKEMLESVPAGGQVWPELELLLVAIGESHLKFIEKKVAAYALLEKEATLLAPAPGLTGVFVNSKDTSALQQWRDEKLAAGVEVDFSACLDDRGEGLTLYRFNDSPRLDFSKLEGDPRILFAHKGGFIAKTRAKLDIREINELVLKARK